MYYILGSTGILSESIISIIKKKNYKIVSRKLNRKFIKTNIFRNKNLKKEPWMSEINPSDTLLLLSNLGSIKTYNNQEKVNKFMKSLKFILRNINKRVKIIFFSSDMVFEGKNVVYSDLSKMKPKNNYGKTKKQIEILIKKNFQNYLILRFCKIYSKKIKQDSIYSQAYLDLKKKKKLKLFYDQKVHYMDIIEFKKILRKILKNNKIKGTYNCPGKLFLSRYDFMLKMFPNYKKQMRKISINFYSYLPTNLKMNTRIFKYL